MKNIGIITIHRFNNWGSVLQAYALNKYLRAQGYNVKTIDYLYENYTKDKINLLFRQELKNDKKSILEIVKFLLYYPKFYRKNIKWIKLFAEFKNKFLPMTKTCYNIDQIKSLNLDYIVLGSDQIWSKPQDIYFGYGLKSVISFSASMPKEKYEKFNSDDEIKIKNYLENIDAISVREESTVDYLSKLTGKKVYNTIDPVFLLDKEDYREVIHNSKIQIKEKYILIYLLYDVKENNLLLEIADKLKEKYGYKIVNISIKDQKIEGSENIGYVGPCECLYLIENAQCVITNSFHGTVLSMVFEKDFYAVTYREPNRLYNILNKAGLMKRLVNKTEYMDFENIDYTEVNNKLSPLIEYSKKYLLENIKNDN